MYPGHGRRPESPGEWSTRMRRRSRGGRLVTWVAVLFWPAFLLAVLAFAAWEMGGSPF
jgi:hypothetical protein